MRGCISLYSYIKPQLLVFHTFHVPVVYLYIPTSNHNSVLVRCCRADVVYLYIPTSNHNLAGIGVSVAMLYIFIFLHQTTTCRLVCFISKSCISLYSYIKPQPPMCKVLTITVVYLYIPTSNHNVKPTAVADFKVVYLYIPTSNHNSEGIFNIHAMVVYLYIPTSNHN